MANIQIPQDKFREFIDNHTTWERRFLLLYFRLSELGYEGEARRIRGLDKESVTREILAELGE